MRVVMVAPEAGPWCGTGGLGEVLEQLPKALRRASQGSCEVSVFLPLYRAARSAAARAGLKLRDTRVQVEVFTDGRPVSGRFLTPEGDQDGQVYFLEQDALFDRVDLYEDQGEPGGCALRFAFFCEAVLEGIPRLLGGGPDLLHAHDWQTALCPLYLAMRPRAAYARTKTVFSIHNLAYQCHLPRSFLARLGLPERLFCMQGLEFHGQLNLLKGGVVSADQLTTVSPRYAEEIQTAAHGCGLEGLLRERARDLIGILNGLPSGYGAAPGGLEEVLSEKAKRRDELLAAFGLRPQPGEFLVGIVSRLVRQKGMDWVAEIVPQLHHIGARLLLVGSGDRELEERFLWLAKVFSWNVSVRIGFDARLAELVLSGSDVVLVPSRYEPCGLNQLKGMRYATVPVVRAVGGLRDTVWEAAEGESAGAQREATGFVFYDPSAEALHAALQRAARLWRSNLTAWRRLQTAGMNQDVSWEAPASAYLRLYRSLLQREQGGAAGPALKRLGLLP